ncbi:DUF4843 domain-containing protein [Chitinophaga sp. sic0106]|uniref:DUF4843 domain-containing protein n=1 Tax=Chitinophaga sp. sic0106 TaxID=2854785 RepID=UPI001C443684|nr:DUF4843 domain-containing protein [Chitinophaga sp. sic0106]MBV7533377.1 DUF4843 domain-containing protein [Chitinophaga sp. sic0106]
MKKVILSILLLTGFFACKKQDIDVYDNEKSGASLYFPIQEVDSTGDISFSFGYLKSSVSDTAVRILVRMLGAPVDYDRPYNLKIADTSTATSEMYSIANKTLAIPAGKTADTVVINLHRAAALRTKGYMLNLELRENEHFGVKYYNNIVTPGSSTPQRYYTRMRVMIDDIAGAPAWWRQGNTYYSLITTYFGTFSTLKFQLILTYYNADAAELTGTSNWPQVNGNLYRIIAWASGLKAYLTLMQAQGTPVLEADGSLMKMGTGAK